MTKASSGSAMRPRVGSSSSISTEISCTAGVPRVASLVGSTAHTGSQRINSAICTWPIALQVGCRSSNRSLGRIQTRSPDRSFGHGIPGSVPEPRSFRPGAETTIVAGVMLGTVLTTVAELALPPRPCATGEVRRWQVLPLSSGNQRIGRY